MKRSFSRAEDDTQELPGRGAGTKPRPRRQEFRKSSARGANPGSLEFLILPAAIVSLILVLPLRGLLTPLPALLFLATLVLFLIPGSLISYSVLDKSFSTVERLPVAFVLSTGVFGLSAVPFLVLHRSFGEYLLACGVVLALALGFALYRLVRRTPSSPWKMSVRPNTPTDLLWVPFAGLVGVLAYVSTVTEEDPNGDSWIYLAYVRDYTNADNLALYSPIFGGQAADSYLSFRTTINGWLMEQAALSRVSGLNPVDLVLNYLSPTLVVLSLLAVYTLARVLFGKGPALLVGSLMALFLLVDLQATIPTAFLTPGHDFVARITEDKYTARFLFLPVALSLAVLYLRDRRLRYLGVFTFVCWSVAIVHPIGLIFVGISTAGLGFFHLIANLRDRASWGTVLGLGAAVASISVPPLLYLLATGSPLLSRLSGSNSQLTDSLIETWVSSKRLLVLGGDSYIAHPALLLNPAVVAAYALVASFVLLRLRRDLAAQLLLGILVFTPLLTFVPPISTPLAEIIGPWVLVRLSWPIFLAAPLVIGWVAWEILDYARPYLEGSRVGLARYAGTFLPVLLVLVLVAATSPSAIAAVRSANEAGEVPQDQTSCLDPVFRWMQNEITEPSTVLASYKENSCIPAHNADANVVTLRGLSRNNQAESDVFGFYSSFTVGAQDMQFLRREGVDYILLPAESLLNAQLRHLPGFVALEAPGKRYNLYSVDQSALVDTTAVTANTFMKNSELDVAAGYYTSGLGGDSNEQFLAYTGLGLLNSHQGFYEDAAANYEQALALDPGEPTLYPLLSDAYGAAGNPDLARLALENGVDRFPEEVGLRTDLSSLLASQDPAAAVQVQRDVVEMFPEIPEYRIILGAYLSLDGDNEAADRQFEYAIRKDPLSAQLHADVGQANQISGREQAAIRHYERALELAPDSQEIQESLETLRQGR